MDITSSVKHPFTSPRDYFSKSHPCFISNVLQKEDYVQEDYVQDDIPSTDSFLDNYKIIKKIGDGSYSNVFCAKNKKDDKLYAVKRISKNRISESYTLSTHLHSEVNFLKKINHKNVVKLYDNYDEVDNIYFVMEYVKGGELFALFKKGRKIIFLPDKTIANYTYQLAMCLKSLYETHGISHRDIKPENILLTKDLQTIKLCDFGFATDNIDEKSNNCYGTWEYMAPEILSLSTVNYKVDIWAMGILIYELFTGKAPFKYIPEETNQFIEKVLYSDVVFPEKIIVPDIAKNLIFKLLDKNPKERPSYDKIVTHPFYSNNLDLIKLNPIRKKSKKRKNKKAPQ